VLSKKLYAAHDKPLSAHVCICVPMHVGVQVGYGRKTYAFTKDLLLSWGQFQLPWAQVDPSTPTKPGTPVCVTANVFGAWTAVPLQVV
jgi:uncharacterized protein (UPF0548 family)